MIFLLNNTGQYMQIGHNYENEYLLFLAMNGNRLRSIDIFVDIHRIDVPMCRVRPIEDDVPIPIAYVDNEDYQTKL
jgi:hypothetical protein